MGVNKIDLQAMHEMLFRVPQQTTVPHTNHTHFTNFYSHQRAYSSVAERLTADQQVSSSNLDALFLLAS